VALLSFDGSPHGGSQRHLPEWQSQPPITPTTIIDHSIVGSAEGAWLGFRDRSVLESHFIVHKSGLIWQLMDTGREADANLNANRFAISIETEDDGDPDTQPWTRAQMESLAWLHNRLVAVHPSIPRRLCPSEAGGGLGYHTLFGAPSAWTPVAKSCPGAVRKRQWRDELLPEFLAGQPVQEDDMTDAEHAALMATKAGVDDILQALRVVDDGTSVNQDTAYQRVYNRTKDLAGRPVPPTADQIAAAVVAALPAVQVDLTPQQIEQLATLIAGLLEVAGHPTLTITGTATPAAPPGG
jgi:N-acetylmuramoyl-L-alanine amidase